LTSVYSTDIISTQSIYFMNTLKSLLPTILIVLSLLLIVAVLVQARGSGVGEAFGGSGAVYRTRRGVEKNLFRATIVLGILFAGLSFLRLLI
jgi:preprotein translocase subunit SecG